MDTATAATLADLRQQLEAARKDNAACLKELDAARKDNAACLKELDAARKDNDFLRGFINNHDVEALRQQLAAARQALNDTDMELARSMRMAEVLATEVRAWRDISSATTADAIEVAAFTLSGARAATDRTQALDAGKFEVKP